MVDPSVTDDLVDFLRAQYDEEEAYARAASQSDHGATATGEHWVWECETTDRPVALDPAMSEYVEGFDYSPVGLRSIEQYPSSVGPLSHLVVHGQQEIRVVDAAHIVRWDPARVLAEVGSKRRILDEYTEARRREAEKPGYDAVGRLETSLAKVVAPALERVVRLLALPYAGRPGYREEWRP